MKVVMVMIEWICFSCMKVFPGPRSSCDECGGSVSSQPVE